MPISMKADDERKRAVSSTASASDATRWVRLSSPVSGSCRASLTSASARQAAAVNYNIRSYPIAREIRARVAKGDFGRILSVTGSYTQDWLLYPEDYNWRVEGDGGTNLRAVADIGTHWMDLAQFVVGRPIDRGGDDQPASH